MKIHVTHADRYKVLPLLLLLLLLLFYTIQREIKDKSYTRAGLHQQKD